MFENWHAEILNALVSSQSNFLKNNKSFIFTFLQRNLESLHLCWVQKGIIHCCSSSATENKCSMTVNVSKVEKEHNSYYSEISQYHAWINLNQFGKFCSFLWSRKADYSSLKAPNF